jgi:hypothetical protein
MVEHDNPVGSVWPQMYGQSCSTKASECTRQTIPFPTTSLKNSVSHMVSRVLQNVSDSALARQSNSLISADLGAHQHHNHWVQHREWEEILAPMMLDFSIRNFASFIFVMAEKSRPIKRFLQEKELTTRYGIAFHQTARLAGADYDPLIMNRQKADFQTPRRAIVDFCHHRLCFQRSLVGRKFESSYHKPWDRT